MNILICNERFLFRFGVDRVNLILGKGLKDLGHTVSFMANKYDKNVVESIASQIIEIPTLEDDYLNSNEYTVKWLEQNWNKHFIANGKPDVVLINGWPFFSAIDFFNKIGIKTIFIDHGAVPLEGFSGGAKNVQEKLRRLRKQFLPDASLIIGISEFMVNSQSKIDVDNKVPTKTILWGADHIKMNVWDSNNLHLSKFSEYKTNLLKPLKFEGKKIILNLGRWEPNCYKNSEASFDIMRQIMRFFPNCVLLILADSRDVEIPDDLQKSILPVGFPDDKELKKIMEEADIGISLSLWEGFNLPIAEMQILGRPVLAFNIGAHPEVIVHPWYLCKNNYEMAEKACDILREKGLDVNIKKDSLNKFMNYFKWERVISEYNVILEELISKNEIHKQEKISLIIDVTNAAKDPANSGVIRVTRRISREFQKYLDPIFVIWNSQDNCYVFPTIQEFQTLGQFNGPLLSNKDKISPVNDRIAFDDYLIQLGNEQTKWLLFTETLDESYGRLVRRYARAHDINLAAIFHDAIPLLFPEFCKDELIRNNHTSYMIGLVECDIVIPNSNYSSSCLDNFWKEHNIKGCALSPNLLPGEFSGFERTQRIRESISNKVSILCVSTLEPRKNHKKLINACLQIQEKHPELDWTLTLVGNRYVGASDIANYVQNISKQNSRIKWLGVVDDIILHELYEEAMFTVYPSIIEGFGMPILESIWHGKPCICYQEGVMSEIAAEGGCLTTDVLDENKLSDDIYRLATNKELLLKLSTEAVKRKIKTWEDYTLSFIHILQSHNPVMKFPVSQNQFIVSQNKRNLEDILYPDCLCKNWQMNHSERLALTALLSRLKPLCTIEVGTYGGGSLSLILQYSKMVFCLDIDPRIPGKFSNLKNVTFLIEPATTTLPILLQELDAENIPIEFVLINGDHSAESIKGAINCLLSYIPKKPLFVVLYDSFNPECRRSILEINWDNSLYVHHVDVDFVPGRLVENKATNHREMRGGLLLAYLKPEIRSFKLEIKQTVEGMYKQIFQCLE